MRYHYQAHSVPGKPTLRVAHDLRELAIAELSASAAWLIQKVMINSRLLLITDAIHSYFPLVVICVPSCFTGKISVHQ